MERKIILIDDHFAQGWATIFEHIITSIYGELIQFITLITISDEAIDTCYQNNPDALFIQDNQLDEHGEVTRGIVWLKIYGNSRSIIIHTADSDIGFECAKYGAKMFMRKDNPEDPMSDETMRKQVIEFHKVIIRHFQLAPELMWLVYNKMGWPEENTNLNQ